MLKIKDLGEKKLLELIQKFCSKDLIGDDAALVKLEKDQELVITTDVLVEGVHFSDKTTTAFDVGWRAVATNLSDLAAMGASPLGVTVGLSLPPELTVAWLEQFYQGMTALNVPIIGGDLTRSTVITVGITAIGQVLPYRAIKRSSAEVGDLIVSTGWHGLSRAGLHLLQNRTEQIRLDSSVLNDLIEAHQRPSPRLDVIKNLWNIPKLERVAGMDSSDGLADAIIGVCQSSGVGARIYHLEIAPQLKDWLSPELALEWTLYGGEDFELVLTLEALFARSLVEQLGYPAMIIGEVIEGQKIFVVNEEHQLQLSQSFQHY